MPGVDMDRIHKATWHIENSENSDDPSRSLGNKKEWICFLTKVRKVWWLASQLIESSETKLILKKE